MRKPGLGQGHLKWGRLPNGHTLIGTANKVVELDRSGKTVWERATEGYVRRVHRR